MTEEMVKNVMNGTGLKVGVIGIGNGGCQVALEASRQGIDVFVMNTSVKDLDDAVLGKDIMGYQIGDGRGSGKNRANAMALLTSKGKEGISEIFGNPYFQKVVNGSDIVVVTFSTGGGTGSGIGPKFASMLHQAYNKKVVIPYGILPKDAESAMAQANSIACVDDMSQTGTPYMLSDLRNYESLPQDVSFANIAKYMVKTIKVLRGDFLKITANGMVDERDMLTVISEPGYMTVHMQDGITEHMMANKGLQDFIIEQMKNSPTCRIHRDGLVQYNLISCNVNSSVDDPLKAGNYDAINEFVGEPKASYVNYAVDDSVVEFSVQVICSGMTVPTDRFAAAKAKITENKEKFDKRSTLSLSDDRKETALGGNESTNSIIMGSASSDKANLDFLDGMFGD